MSVGGSVELGCWFPGTGFGGLTALNLFRCIESLNKTKEADDKVMLENRALGTSGCVTARFTSLKCAADPHSPATPLRDTALRPLHDSATRSTHWKPQIVLGARSGRGSRKDSQGVSSYGASSLASTKEPANGHRAYACVLQVLTGQDLKPWLKKEPEFHRRILAACYANRVVLRVSPRPSRQRSAFVFTRSILRCRKKAWCLNHT